jgi:uncharacterized coiled-coil protein SlyX
MGTGAREISLEAALASFETTLEQHTKLIENMAGKVDDMDKTLAGVKIQMQHLVTKESCAEGRKELAEDLKARMDGDREITGVGITVPKLWQQYVEATRGPMTPVPGGASSVSSKSRTTTSVPPPPKSAMYYVKTASSVISLVFAIITITFFAYKMMDRLDQQQAVMQQQQSVMRDIQNNLKQLETTEEAATRRTGGTPPQPGLPVGPED